MGFLLLICLLIGLVIGVVALAVIAGWMLGGILFATFSVAMLWYLIQDYFKEELDPDLPP